MPAIGMDKRVSSGAEIKSSGMVVRLATLEDLPFVLALARENRLALGFEESDADVLWSTLGGRIDIKDRMGTARLTVVEDCGTIPCGFLLSIQYDNLVRGYGNELYLLAVNAASRRNGAGRCLVADAVRTNQALSMCTFAIVRSEASLRLLTEHFGFTIAPSSRGNVVHKCGVNCSGEATHLPG